MKILIVADEWPWPPHQGDRVRLDAICRVLTVDHQATLLGRPSESGPKSGSKLQTVALEGQRNPKLIFRYPNLPATMAVRADRQVRETVAVLAAQHERVLFYQLKTTAWLDQRLYVNKTVIDLTDSLGLYYRRRGGALWTMEAFRALRQERELAKNFPTVVSSEHDRDAIDPTGEYNVTVARNGYWMPDGLKRNPEPNSIISVGNWNYYPNRAGMDRFIQYVWPNIKRQRPEATLWIVGRGTSPLTFSVEGVHWKGEVDDLGSWYERAWLVVAPVYVGSGMKTKIMEALFYNVPVVASQFATEGIEPNALLFPAADDQTFAKLVVKGLTQSIRWEEDLRNDFLERNSWHSTLRPLIDVIERGTKK